GRVLGNRSYYPRFVIEQQAGEILHAFIAQFYLSAQQRPAIPPEILVNHVPDDCKSLCAALQQVAGHAVTIKHTVRGHRLQWLGLAMTNAQHGLMSHLNSRQSMEQRFTALQGALGLDWLPGRLECFDISHSAGEATVASCVVFDSNGPLK